MLKTIIALSFVLAIGFLLAILSCALFRNWLPLLVVATFLLAPVPNAVCSKIASSTDYMDESPSASVDFGNFLTGFLLLTGVALPAMLAHVGVINHAASIMSVIGGVLIYGSIIVYGRFFSNPNDDF